MIISERIIKVMKQRNMTQAEFAKQVGISTSTISEWKKRKTNPTVEKIMDICNVLQITPEQLLTGIMNIFLNIGQSGLSNCV